MVSAHQPHTVYKYAIPMGDKAQIQLPKGAVILTVQEEHDFVPKFTMLHQADFWVWALVDPLEQEKETRTFRIAGTGHPVEPAQYIATVKIVVGEKPLYFHIFEEV